MPPSPRKRHAALGSTFHLSRDALVQHFERYRVLVHLNGVIGPEAERDGHEDAFLADRVGPARLRQVHVEAALHHRRRYHEDNQQHEHHVDQWDDVDLGEGRSNARAAPPPPPVLRLTIRLNLRHYGIL